MHVAIFILIFMLAALIHLVIGRKPRTTKHILEVMVMYYLAVWPGLTGLWAFLGHAFLADQVAAYIGWLAGSPFQFEIAVANLSYGVLGILCLFIGGNFWLATGLGQAVFMWGAAYGHIQQIIVNGNYHPGNAGAVLYLDIIIPLVFFGLYIAYRRAKN